jgi:hypothetical protein
MSAPLVGVTPIFAVCFWGNDMGKLIAVCSHWYPFIAAGED